MTNGNYLDHLILKALREDDEKALSHLFESQYNRLFRSGLKLGADSELVKESIQAVFKDLWQYRHSLSDVESFEAYLKTALKRRIFKEIKKQQKNRTLDESAFEERTLSVPSYEDTLIEQQTQNIEKQQLMVSVRTINTAPKRDCYAQIF